MALPAVPLIIRSGPAGTDLLDKTVYFKLRLGTFGNSRRISSSQIEVEADKRMVKANKELLDSPELKTIERFDGTVQKYVRNICLPFDRGIHFCPLAMVETLDERMEEFFQERQVLVKEFTKAYVATCERSARLLDKLYNPADYPPEQSVESEFSFEWQYITLGVPKQLGTISASILRKEREKAAQSLKEASQEIQNVMRTTLATMVERLRNTLTPEPDGRKKRFYETAVTNLTDFLATFDLRNVMDDQQLKGLVDQARALLNGLDVETIKNTDTLRDRLRDGMADIAGKLEPLVELAPGRRIRLVED